MSNKQTKKKDIITSDNKPTPAQVAAKVRKGTLSRDMSSHTNRNKNSIAAELSDTSITPWVDKVSEVERRDYFWYFDFKVHPISDAALEALAFKLIRWAKDTDEEALKLCDFYHKQNISREKFFAWRRRSPALNAAANIAIEIIGSRREKGALKRTYDPSTVKLTLGMYDLDYKAFLVWMSKLDVAEERKNELFEVYMKKLSGDDDEKKKEVPAREKEG